MLPKKKKKIKSFHLRILGPQHPSAHGVLRLIFGIKMVK